MGLVVKLIGAGLLFDELEDPLFDDGENVDAVILQLQVRDLKLEDDLLAQLSVNRDPVGSRLLNNLSFLVFFDDEPALVDVGQDVLLLQPLHNFALALAQSFASLLLALVKHDGNRARAGRVVVTLHFEELGVGALELLVVVSDVV
jgi:hypothetical protein